MKYIRYSDKFITYLLFELLTLKIYEPIFVLLRFKVKNSSKLDPYTDQSSYQMVVFNLDNTTLKEILFTIEEKRDDKE